MNDLRLRDAGGCMVEKDKWVKRGKAGHSRDGGDGGDGGGRGMKGDIRALGCCFSLSQAKADLRPANRAQLSLSAPSRRY